MRNTKWPIVWLIFALLCLAIPDYRTTCTTDTECQNRFGGNGDPE